MTVSDPADYGQWKMTKFKEMARELLLPGEKSKQQRQQAWEQQQQMMTDRNEEDVPTISQQSDRDQAAHYYNNYDMYSTSQVGRESIIDPNGDILYAYKQLKKIMVKGQGSKMPSDAIGGPRNYQRTTIAMQQHSTKRMDKELLRYSLQQPSK